MDIIVSRGVDNVEVKISFRGRTRKKKGGKNKAEEKERELRDGSDDSNGK
jgi:hypothetical protein